MKRNQQFISYIWKANQQKKWGKDKKDGQIQTQVPTETLLLNFYVIFSYFSEMKQPIGAHRGGWQADRKGPSIWNTFCHEKGRMGTWAGTATSCGRRTWNVSSSLDWHTITCLSPGPHSMSIKKVCLFSHLTRRISIQDNRMEQAVWLCCFSLLSIHNSGASLSVSCAVLQQGDWWLTGLQFVTYGHTLPLWPSSSSLRARRMEVNRYSDHLWQLRKALLPNVRWSRQTLDHHQRALCVRQTEPWRWYPRPGVTRTGDCCLPGRSHHAACPRHGLTQLQHHLQGNAERCSVAGWSRPQKDALRLELPLSAAVHLLWGGLPGLCLELEITQKSWDLPSTLRVRSWDTKGEPAILGTADLFALNYYTSRKVKPGGGSGKTSMKSDRDVEEVLDPSWLDTPSVVCPGLLSCPRAWGNSSSTWK